MDKFSEAEQAGRALFLEILQQYEITDYEESLEQFDTMDYYYTNIKGQRVGAEIKKRADQYEVYDTHLLEWSKFIAICKRLQSKEIDRAIYVNFFGDSVVYIYPFKEIIRAYTQGRIKKQYLYCNVTTCSDRGQRDKAVLMIPKEIGVRAQKVGDKWIKSLK